MPANKEAFIRYRIIDGCLRNKQKPFPTIMELAEACEDVLGTSFSKSTIQKDIYAMRNDEGLNYQAPIKFHKYNNGYSYTDPKYTISSVPLTGNEINAIEFAAGILEQFRGTELHEQFDNAVGKILETLSIRKILNNEQLEKIIQVEKAYSYKGTEYLSQIVDLIKKSSIVKFDYHSFERDDIKGHILHPYLLKEYRNRWYLIGYHPGYKEIRTFGVDRISKLQDSGKEYTMIKDFDPVMYFEHSFGITNGKPEEIVLSFSPQEGLYIKSQSLHKTQKIIIDTKEEFRVSIKVMPSYELQMQLLSYGENVKVLKPKYLADKIKEIHKISADQYL